MYNPSPDDRLAVARDTARALSVRVKGRNAPLRTAFVEQLEPDAAEPPLATVLRGGRGGAVRLKLLLSMIWVAAQPPHDVALPARAWAELLGLSDPSLSGARRVVAALRWLESRRLIETEPKPGAPTRILLREESGSGRPYRVPGAEIKRLMAQGDDWYPHRYVKIPSQLWTNGWIASLSGSGTAMFLVLLVRASATEGEVWFSPGFADERFRLSADTRQRGLSDLRTLGLVEVKKRPLSRSRLDVVRLRNAYTLRSDALDKPAHVVLLPRAQRERDRRR